MPGRCLAILAVLLGLRKMNNLNSHQKPLIHWRLLITATVLIFVLLNVFVGVIWIFRNMETRESI